MEANEDSPWIDDMTRKVIVDCNAGKWHPEDKQHSMSRYANRKAQGKPRWVSLDREMKDLIKKSKCFYNESAFLQYLLQNRSWDGKIDKHKTWDGWYLKRDLIVASIGEVKMTDDTGIPRSTLKDWIKRLEDDNLIKREYEWGELVIVLGRVVDGVDVYYYEML